MSFKLPDLIVESVIRDGLRNARLDETVIDDVFGDLTRAYTSQKYGDSEIAKIKTMMRTKEVSVVHAFNLVNANLPCYSIQLADDREDEQRSHFGNFVSMEATNMNDAELTAMIVVPSFQPTAYNSLTGVVSVPDSANLTSVYANLLFRDSEDVDHQILGGIVNDPGQKQFIIAKGAEVSLAAGAIVTSSIDYKLYQRHGNMEQAQLIIGVHSGDALTTKYLYVLLKYFMLSRRRDMIARGLELSSYSGSDFNRNVEYGADAVFTRFFHLTGKLQHQWSEDRVALIDNVNIKVRVPKDRLGNAALNLTNSTVQVKE